MIRNLNMSEKYGFAVLQLRSTINKKSNFENARKLIEKTTKKNVKVIIINFTVFNWICN